MYFNEAAIVSDEWERREAERRQRALDLLIDRAPGGEVLVETRVIQCPDVQRALGRPELADAFDVLVTTERVRLAAPVLTLRFASGPDAVPNRRLWPYGHADAEPG